VSAALQIDDLREWRVIYREHEEWRRDMEDWARNWTLEWDPWNSRPCDIESEISE